jgi:hypothetical protein
MKALVAVFAVLLLVISAHAACAEPIQDRTTINATIDKAAKPFQFEIRIAKDDGFIEQIDVFSPSRKKIQSIEFPPDAEMPCASCKVMEFEDLNFDGYNDLLLLVGWGSGGSFYEPWMYNPTRKLFQKANFDREFANPSVDKKNKVLILSSHVGCCEGTKSYYHYGNGKFHVFKEEKYFVENKRDVVVVRQLIQGTWKVISKKYGDTRE